MIGRLVARSVSIGLLAALAALAMLAMAPSSSRAVDFFVLLTRPENGEVLFGEVEVVAEVSPEGAAAVVELWLDGDKAGEATEPPFRWLVDVGSENRPHTFEARAIGPEGEFASDRLTSAAIPVDEVVTVELQQLYVTALATSGERVLDLDRSDFEVRDNGARQEIVTFTAGHVPLAAALLIDASVSMRGRPLQFALRAARAFAAGVESGDEVSVQLFSDRLLFETPYSNSMKRSTGGLDGVEAEGGTALNDHLYRALRQLELRQGRRVVVLLTDGIDSHSVLRMQEVQWMARRSRAMIYWVRTEPWLATQRRTSAWKSAGRYRSEYEKLEEVVTESGGRILTLESVAEAEGAMREIVAELREQYVIGYYPSASRNDGAWHRVRVEVRRPGISIRARGGYIDY